MVEASLRKVRRSGYALWFKDQARVIGITIALGVMFFGLMHVLGIEGPIFSGDDETELAPR
jgi:hypothetical protein